MTVQEKFFFRPISIDDPQGLIKVDVARSLDEIMAALAVRNIVFVGEQRCPYDEEFDGNDFAGATHLLARVRGEPAGTLRLRWFAGFFKIERAAVKPEYRGESISAALMTAAIDLARRKGYYKALGHIQAHLTSFWLRFGCRIRPDRDRFVFSDYEYVEIEFDLEPAADSLNLDTDPLILLRPEGRWNEPGVLDRSAARGGSNKSRKADSG
jgi:predicted GNAT family N-acyltransferase